MFINVYLHPCYKQDDIAMQRINEKVGDQVCQISVGAVSICKINSWKNITNRSTWYLFVFSRNYLNIYTSIGLWI